MAGSINTGTVDRTGRTIFKGKRGGYFVRKGASGTKVYRKTSGAPVATGQMNALGRAIMKGPRGGLFVMVSGQRRPPAKGRRPAKRRLRAGSLSPSSSPVTQKLMAYMRGPKHVRFRG